jgi:hypothetical protein
VNALKKKKKHAYLGLKKGAWILCIAGGKGLLSLLSWWVAELAGLAGLRAGLAGLRACWPTGLLPCFSFL